MRITKRDIINEYNTVNPGYDITGTMKMSTDHIEARIKYGARDLDDLYQSYSNAKRDSYADILATYKPRRILALAGSCFSYTVLLIAGNGDTLLITKSNNYLVEVVEEAAL